MCRAARPWGAALQLLSNQEDYELESNDVKIYIPNTIHNLSDTSRKNLFERENLALSIKQR